MARNITVGIDIGTHQTKVVVTEAVPGEAYPRILGTGFTESRGLRHGYIVNIAETSRGLRTALAQASKASGVTIRRAYVSVGGIGLSSYTSSGSIVISRADAEITELDTGKAMELAREAIPSAFSQNRRVIYEIPIKYRVDGKDVLGHHPLGLKGMKLEVRALFISCLENHLKDLVEAVEEAGVEIIDIVASPIAASFVALTKAQKIAGCILANIGSETTSIVVFENNIPVSLEVFPIGSTDITHDIALGLRIDPDEAESIKHGGVTQATYPRKRLDEIINARLSDMFELIEAHLKKLNKSGLLPAGIVITGGGSLIGTIEELARVSLKLPSRVTHLHFPDKEKGKVRDAFFAVALGLCILGATEGDEHVGSLRSFSVKGLGGLLRSMVRTIKGTLRPFLP